MSHNWSISPEKFTKPVSTAQYYKHGNNKYTDTTFTGTTYTQIGDKHSYKNTKPCVCQYYIVHTQIDNRHG